jgi:uncharacterized protein (DUF58 family)
MALIRERPSSKGSRQSALDGAKAFTSLESLLALKHRARGFSFLPRQPVHSILAGRHASRLRGRGLNFEELRHYFEGDDTRTIDWPATARLGSPHVRVYTDERDRPVLLLVDQRSSMFFGSRRAMKSVAAAEAAALAAWRVTSLGDRIGAVVFGDSEAVDVRPQSRDVGAVRVIHEIVRQNLALGTNPSRAGNPDGLNAALRRALKLATHDWLVCLISDAAGANDETTQLVTRITAHNDVLSVFVHDPLESRLPDIGTAVFGSGDRQIEIDTASNTFGQRFAEDHAEWRSRLAALSRERAIPVLPVPTDRDVAQQLRDSIGKRPGRTAAMRAGGRP